MSFLKFWGSKKSSGGGKKDEGDPKHGDGSQEPDLEKRRLRHSLSISRSGRFKQRKRERSQISEIFDCQDGGPTTASSSSSSSLASQTQGESENQRGTKTSGATQAHHFRSAATSSPKFSCRDINSGMGAPPGGLRMGHPVVT